MEIVISLCIKAAVVVLLGVPVLAVVAFEIVLNATSMFTHANVAVPRVIEPVMRRVLVTPQMHEVHHSIVRGDTDSNFGFNFSWWDRMFGTYRAAPSQQAESGKLIIGIPEFRDRSETRLDRLITQPFRDCETKHSSTGRD